MNLFDQYGGFFKKASCSEYYIMIENIGNYIYKHPAWKDGDNSIRKTNLSYREWENKELCYFVGNHKIIDFCGIDAKLINKEVS